MGPYGPLSAPMEPYFSRKVPTVLECNCHRQFCSETVTPVFEVLTSWVVLGKMLSYVCMLTIFGHVCVILCIFVYWIVEVYHLLGRRLNTEFLTRGICRAGNVGDHGWGGGGASSNHLHPLVAMYIRRAQTLVRKYPSIVLCYVR